MPGANLMSRFGSTISSFFGQDIPPPWRITSSTQPATDTDKKKAADHVDWDIRSCFVKLLDIHDDIQRSMSEADLSSIKGEDAKGTLISHLTEALCKFVNSFQSLGCDAHSAGADRRNVSNSPLLKRSGSKAGPTPQQPVAQGADVHNVMRKCQDGIGTLNHLVARLNNKIDELPDNDDAKPDLVAARDSALVLLRQFQNLLAALSANQEQHRQHHAEDHQEALTRHLPTQDSITA